MYFKFQVFFYSMYVFDLIIELFELTCFTVGQSFFEEERAVTKEFAAIGTFEAFRVEMLSNCV